MQDFEMQLLKLVQGSSLRDLDETDIETLIDFAAYIMSKNQEAEKKKGKTVTINGKLYKMVDTFSQKDN